MAKKYSSTVAAGGNLPGFQIHYTPTLTLLPAYLPTFQADRFGEGWRFLRVPSGLLHHPIYGRQRVPRVTHSRQEANDVSFKRLSPRGWRGRERVTVREVEGWRRALFQVEGMNRDSSPTA